MQYLYQVLIISVFPQSTTNITVREDTPPDAVIAKVEALDLDSGTIFGLLFSKSKLMELMEFSILLQRYHFFIQVYKKITQPKFCKFLLHLVI